MSEAQFTRQVLAFNQWKKDIIREAVRFRNWLNEHHLMTDDLKEQIEEALQQLISDQITVAFAGEFSRGKTELINALFFSQYGRRVLPSTIGRTTMCPTEILYEKLYSLLLVGGYSYFDAKQYGRLDALPRALAGHVVYDRLNWPNSECASRGLADGPCGTVPGR